jgi:hypothetical protein
MLPAIWYQQLVDEEYLKNNGWFGTPVEEENLPEEPLI